MKRLHFTGPNSLDVLHDELIVAIPSLAPQENNGVRSAVMEVQGDDNNVWLTVPDGADEPAIAAVVQSHDPASQQPDPRRGRLDRIAELTALARSDWTSAQLRELIELLAQELTK